MGPRRRPHQVAWCVELAPPAHRTTRVAGDDHPPVGAGLVEGRACERPMVSKGSAPTWLTSPLAGDGIPVPAFEGRVQARSSAWFPECSAGMPSRSSAGRPGWSIIDRDCAHTAPASSVVRSAGHWQSSRSSASSAVPTDRGATSHDQLTRAQVAATHLGGQQEPLARSCCFVRDQAPAFADVRGRSSHGAVGRWWQHGCHGEGSRRRACPRPHRLLHPAGCSIRDLRLVPVDMTAWPATRWSI